MHMSLKPDLCLLHAAILLVFGCSAPTGPDSPHDPTGSLGQLQTSLDFHIAPLVGWVSIRPDAKREDLSYQIDLNGDDIPEEQGPLYQGVDVGYRYDAPGVHRIRAYVRAGAAEQVLSQVVVVPDPEAWIPAGHYPRQSNRSTYGLAYSRPDQSLYALEGFIDPTLMRFTPDLSLQARIDLPQTSLMWPPGCPALSGDSLLFYVHGPELLAVRLRPVLEFVGPIGSVPEGSRIAVATDGSLYIGGVGSIERRGSGAGRIARTLPGRFYFSLSPSGARVATLGHSEDYRTTLLHVLDGQSLETLRVIDFGIRSAYVDLFVVGFSGDEKQLYGYVRGFYEAWLFVVETESGRLIRKIMLGTPSPAGGGFGAPLTRHPSLPLLAMAMGGGAFVIDEVMALPRWQYTTFGDCCTSAVFGESQGATYLFTVGSQGLFSARFDP